MRSIAVTLFAIVLLSGCTVLYTDDYADRLTIPDELPQPGLDAFALTQWFEERGYVPGPRVLQAEAELRRRRRDPLVYSQPGDREWWLTAHRTVQHVCVTRHIIYYRLATGGTLDRAVHTHRNQC